MEKKIVSYELRNCAEISAFKPIPDFLISMRIALQDMNSNPKYKSISFSSQINSPSGICSGWYFLCLE